MKEVAKNTVARTEQREQERKEKRERERERERDPMNEKKKFNAPYKLNNKSLHQNKINNAFAIKKYAGGAGDDNNESCRNGYVEKMLEREPRRGKQYTKRERAAMNQAKESIKKIVFRSR